MEVITGAPIAFSIAVLFAGFAIWWVFRFFHKRELGQLLQSPVLKERLVARDEEIARLKERLTAKEEEIARLASPARRPEKVTAIETTGRLSLRFDLKTHRVQDGNLFQYFVGVRNAGDAPVDKVSITIEEIQSLTDPIGAARLLAKFRGRSLMLKEDIHKQNDLPKKDFYIFGHSEVELIVMQGQTQYQRIYLEHTEYSFGSSVTMSGLRARVAARRELPAGKYQLHLLLKGSDGTIQRKTFLASLDTERFDFEEDTAQTQRDNSVPPAV
jgi:hypothetical protein